MHFEIAHGSVVVLFRFMYHVFCYIFVEHWRKLAWATFLGNFPILLVQQFCGALMNSCLLEYATVFPIKNKF